MVINTNIQAQSAADTLATSQLRLSKSLARLSSGSKIVDPSDDAGGLAVSSRMDAQIKRLDAAKGNVGNAISFMQAQDGHLSRIGKALDRMSELSVMALDVTKSDNDRKLYQAEFVQLQQHIIDTARKDFNGVSLFSASTLGIIIDSEGKMINVPGMDVGTTNPTSAYFNAFTTGVSISTTTGAISALAFVKLAITQLSSDRAFVGAYQTRLNYTVEQLQISKENLVAANSNIKDVDVATESTEFAKFNILVQAGTAMLAQANNIPQQALKLLQ
jgi:flagellin